MLLLSTAKIREGLCEWSGTHAVTTLFKHQHLEDQLFSFKTALVVQRWVHLFEWVPGPSLPRGEVK